MTSPPAETAGGSAHGAEAENIVRIFDSLGLRNTRQRRLIADRLAAAAVTREPFGTDQLWKDLQDVDPDIGRATVYRAVELLLREGILDRVAFSDGTVRYRVCGLQHHHHLTCVQCHRVIEVEACLPAEVLDTIASSTNFSIEGHAVELFGRCGLCRQ